MTTPNRSRYFQQPPAYGAETRGAALVAKVLLGGYGMEVQAYE